MCAIEIEMGELVGIKIGIRLDQIGRFKLRLRLVCGLMVGICLLDDRLRFALDDQSEGISSLRFAWLLLALLVD